MSLTPTLPLNSLAREAGLRGTMLHFTPSSTPVVIQDFGPINLGGATQEFTVEAWIRAEPVQTPPNGTQVGLICWSYKGDSTLPQPFSLYLNWRVTNVGTGAGYWTLQGARVEGQNTVTVTAPIDLTDGLFHHIALVRRVVNGTTTLAYLQLYIDGDTDPSWVAASSTSLSASAASGARMTLGGGLLVWNRNEEPAYCGLNGDMSQIRVWSGALTGTQIGQLRYEALTGPIQILDAEGAQASGSVTFNLNTTPGVVVSTAEGVWYFTINNTTQNTPATVIAWKPGPTGDTANGTVTTLVATPDGSRPTMTNSYAITGGADAYGGQPATGWVNLQNTGHEAITLPTDPYLRVETAQGVAFQLTSGGTISAGSASSFPIRAVSVGEAGNVAISAITQISASNLFPTLTVSNTVAPTGGVNRVPDDARDYSTGTVVLRNDGTGGAVTLPVGTVLGVRTGGVVDTSKLYTLTEQVVLATGESSAPVKIQAVVFGAGQNQAANAINWVSPLYLGPRDSVTVVSSSAIASVPPRTITLVGCWCCDEGFGRVIYNYAASPSALSQGNGSFSLTLWRAYYDDVGLTLPAGVSDPEWVVTTLMAPPPFVA